MLADGIRILIYAGERDLICNWLGNQRYVFSIAGKRVIFQVVSSSEIQPTPTPQTLYQCLWRYNSREMSLASLVMFSFDERLEDTVIASSMIFQQQSLFLKSWSYGEPGSALQHMAPPLMGVHPCLGSIQTNSLALADGFVLITRIIVQAQKRWTQHTNNVPHMLY